MFPLVEEVPEVSKVATIAILTQAALEVYQTGDVRGWRRDLDYANIHDEDFSGNVFSGQVISWSTIETIVNENWDAISTVASELFDTVEREMSRVVEAFQKSAEERERIKGNNGARLV